jgi:hypothetical protein
MAELHKTWDDRYQLLNPPPQKLGVSVTGVNFAAGIDSGDSVIIATAVLTVALPSAVGGPGGGKGALFYIKNALTFVGVVTVAPSGVQKIDNVAASVALAQFDSIVLVSDGSNWWILAHNP